MKTRETLKMPHLNERAVRLLLLIVTLLTLWPRVGFAQGSAAIVGVETVEMRAMSETVPVFAEIVAEREGAVASRTEGYVKSVSIIEGQSVSAGDVLAVIDDELLSIKLEQAQAHLAEAKAGVGVAEARLQLASTNYERIEQLRDTAAFSEGRLDELRGAFLQAKSQLAEANARMRVAESSQSEAQYRLDRSRIIAPYSGIVTAVMINPGQYIQVGANVGRLLDTDALEVEASVPAQYISGLKPNMRVNATRESGDAIDLVVRAILPIEEAATRTRPVRFSSSELIAEKGFAVGQSITVSIPVGASREVLTVPKDALVQSSDGWTVFVNVDGKAMVKEIAIGNAVGERFEVMSGINAGDKVVVRGNERLRPGQPIEPMKQQ